MHTWVLKRRAKERNLTQRYGYRLCESVSDSLNFYALKSITCGSSTLYVLRHTLGICNQYGKVVNLFYEFSQKFFYLTGNWPSHHSFTDTSYKTIGNRKSLVNCCGDKLIKCGHSRCDVFQDMEKTVSDLKSVPKTLPHEQNT